MGKAAYDAMDPEIRGVLEETAREMETWARERGAAADERLLEELKSAGMKVNEVDREAFVDASKPIYDAFAAEVEGGQALIDEALSLTND